MAKGKSGRVVLEIDPDLKRNIYLELEKRQQTLKEWFVKEAESLLYGEQKGLFDRQLVNEPGKRKRVK